MEFKDFQLLNFLVLIKNLLWITKEEELHQISLNLLKNKLNPYMINHINNL